MGGQRGQRIPEQEVTGGGGGPAVSPTDYGSNDFMAAYLRATKTPKQSCEERWRGGGLDLHSPEALQGYDVDANIGAWCTDDGERAYGMEGSANWHKHGIDLPGHRIEGSGPNVNGQFGWLGDQFAVGGQANVAEIGFGSEDDWDASRDDDDQFRVGLSAGGGAAVRVHHSDKDGDGNPEYGLGFDYLMGSMDYKTETPVRDAVMFGLMGPVNAINWMFGDSLLESVGVGSGVRPSAAPDLSRVASAAAEPERIGPAVQGARETVPPVPARPALPEGSVFAQPSPASFLDAHPGSVFDRR